MNRILAVVGISVLSTAVLPLVGQEARPFSQIMKEINGSVGEVKKGFEGGNKEAVASGGEKLEALFKEVEAFFTKRSTADAVELAKNAQAAAKELLGEATSGTKPGAEAAFAKVTGYCKGCHDAHREKLPEGGFKIK